MHSFVSNTIQPLFNFAYWPAILETVDMEDEQAQADLQEEKLAMQAELNDQELKASTSMCNTPHLAALTNISQL